MTGTIVPFVRDSSTDDVLKEPDQQEIEILQRRGAFLLPPKHLCDELVECFFKWVAPVVSVMRRLRSNQALTWPQPGEY